MEALKDNDINDSFNKDFLFNLITNAPAVECETSLQQGEPVAWALFYDNGIVHHVTKYVPPTMNGSHLRYKPLYTAPPQGQDDIVRKAVKDALEKAAKIAFESRFKKVDSYLTALDICGEIRALIDKE